MALLVAREMAPARVFVVGESGAVAVRQLRRAGVPGGAIADLTRFRTSSEVVDAIALACGGGAFIFGIGNTKGVGQMIADFFAGNGVLM